MSIHIDEEEAEIASGPALACFEEGLRDREQDVDCGVPGLGLNVAGSDDTGLLLGFVVLAFCDSADISLGNWKDGEGEVLFLQAHYDLLDFGRHFGDAGPGGGRWKVWRKTKTKRLAGEIKVLALARLMLAVYNVDHDKVN